VQRDTKTLRTSGTETRPASRLPHSEPSGEEPHWAMQPLLNLLHDQAHHPGGQTGALRRLLGLHHQIPNLIMATAIVPANQVVSLPGTALIVQLYRIPEIPNQIVFDIHRNGTRERNFTLTELRQVLADATQLLAQAQVPGPTPAKK